MTPPDGPPPDPEWKTWTWEFRGSRRREVSWFGVLLVVTGVALLINQVNPAVTLVSLLLLGLGVALAIAWLFGGWKGGTAPALVFLALGIQGVLSDIGELTGDGWTSIAMAIGLVLAWLIGLYQGRQRTWALVVGVVLGLFGLSRLRTDAFAGIPALSAIAAALLVVAGIYLLIRPRPGRG